MHTQNQTSTKAAGQPGLFQLSPTKSCDLIELAHLEAEADRFRAQLVDLELAFFRRVVQQTFAEHPGLETVSVEVGAVDPVLLIFLDGDLETVEFEMIRKRLESALGEAAITAAIGTWTAKGGPITSPGAFVNTLA